MRDIPFATSAAVTPVQSPLWRPRKRYLPPAPGLPCPALKFCLPHAWRRGGSSVDPAQRHTPLLPFLGYPAISFELIFSLLPSYSPPRPAPPQETQALSCELSTPSWGHSCGVLTRVASGQVCQGRCVRAGPSAAAQGGKQVTLLVSLPPAARGGGGSGLRLLSSPAQPRHRRRSSGGQEVLSGGPSLSSTGCSPQSSWDISQPSL